MSTQKRKDSSRANGAKSRGPVTPEGRAHSRAARLTHGLTVSLVLLSYESKKDFEALRDEYLDDYQPQTRSQVDLVDQLVATRWRLNRVIAIQTGLMELQLDRQQPEVDREFKACGTDVRAAIAYRHLCDDSRALESLHRHEARLSAEFRRTMKLLDAQLKNQKLHHEPSDEKPPRPDEDTEGTEPQPSTVGDPPSTTPEPPPSTIHHPSTSSITIDQFDHHPPSTIDHRPPDAPPPPIRLES